MKFVAKQSLHRTLTDLYKVLEKRRALTVTYTDDKGETTIRTVEPYSIRTTANGSIIIRAMDRRSGEARSFRVSRIEAYTLHRSAFQIQRPADDENARRPAPAHSAAALIAYELERDSIAAAYRSNKVGLAA